MNKRSFVTRGEIKRVVFMSMERHKGCRVGQAFLNQFPDWHDDDRQFNLNLWEDDNFESVVSKIHMVQQMNGSIERLDSKE